MSTVQSSTATDPYAALNAKTNSSLASESQKEIQDRFLTLLVAQMKNQDPLNPLDNAQVTTQLSQISTVTGLEKLNGTLSELLDGYDTGQSMQAAGMIGKLVLVPGSKLELSKGVGVAGVELGSAASNVTVKVVDSTGKTVYSEDLGKKDAGSFAFVWDGTTDAGAKAADGHYTFKVEATSSAGSVTVNALQAGTVNAVVRGKTGFTLDLGAAGNVPYSAVRQIL